LISQQKSFLWEVKTDSGSSYLLGSIHLLKKEVYPLNPVIENSFDKCGALVLEANLSGDNLAKASFAALQKGMYQGEDTLEKNVSAKTYRLAAEKLKAIGLTIDTFKKFKPWMLAMTVQSFQLIKMGFQAEYGIDFYFSKKAEEVKKEILELEGFEFQVNLLNSFSVKEQEDFLFSSLVESDKLEKEIDKIVNAWLFGNAKQLEEVFLDSVKKYPELEGVNKRFLDDRNVKMVEKIVQFIKEGKKCFVIVGAAHMVGKKGVVQLLKDMGYNVEQL